MLANLSFCNHDITVWCSNVTECLENWLRYSMMSCDVILSRQDLLILESLLTSFKALTRLQILAVSGKSKSCLRGTCISLRCLIIDCWSVGVRFGVERVSERVSTSPSRSPSRQVIRPPLPTADIPTAPSRVASKTRIHPLCVRIDGLGSRVGSMFVSVKIVLL